MLTAARGSRFARYVPVLGMVAFSVLIAGFLLVVREPLERLGEWGYAGTFVVMIVNNATIVLPAAGHAFVAAASQTLNPLLVGVVGGLGGALGELTGYAVGRTGRIAVPVAGLDERLRRIPRRLFGPALFVFAATPLPFDVAGILAGTMRYSVWRFLLWAGAGKVINTVGIALASRYTVEWLQRVFG